MTDRHPIAGYNGRPRLSAAVHRAKLREPVRLYLWLALVVLLAGAVAAGLLTGDWAQWAISYAATVLAVVPATAAARASSWSTMGMVGEVRRGYALAQTAAAVDDPDIDVARALGLGR